MEDNRPDQPPPADINSGNWIRVGGPIDRVVVTLRLNGESLDPDEVTRLLCCQPTFAIRKGDVFPKGRYRRIAETGMWRLEGDRPDSEDLEVQVQYLLGRVTSDESVWEDLARRFSVDLFCGVFLEAWNRGFELSAPLLSELSRRKLMIGFDVYSHSPDPCAEGEEEDQP